jgi:hypothetical protein
MGAFDRYRYFIKRIADTSSLWALKNGQNDFALSEVDNKTLISVWSAREFIDSCLNGIWENYVPVCLSIDDLNKSLIPFIIEKNYLIDVFPVNNRAGFVVTPTEFVRDLNIEIDNYE